MNIFNFTEAGFRNMRVLLFFLYSVFFLLFFSLKRGNIIDMFLSSFSAIRTQATIIYVALAGGNNHANLLTNPRNKVDAEL